MIFHFTLLTNALLLFSTAINGNEINEAALYGVCYQFNTPNSNSPQIILSTQNKHINFTAEGFQTSSTDPISCIWFTSNEYAHTASAMSVETAQQNFNNGDNVQTVAPNQGSQIHCNNQQIYLSDTSITSKHLCSDLCYADEQQLCSNLVTARSIPVSYQGQSDVKPLIPSMFGISGVCIAFIIVCAVIYCFGVRYTRWNEEKSGDETEQVIGDVLEEIAKYTIGDDDEEGFYGDWIDGDSDRSESTHSLEEELGMTILRVVSHQQLPEIPNPSIFSSSSEEESDEEQCREDLKVAKETLYATSFGTDNPYLRYSKNLTPINEQIIKKKVDRNNKNRDRSKKSPLLNGSGADSSDYKISSDGCTNSDLP